jgi:hypothetical protein
MPDNEVKVLIPADSEEPQDRLLRSGQSITISDVEVDKNTPRGKEFFKAIFTKTPNGFKKCFNRTRTRGSGNLSSLKKWWTTCLKRIHKEQGPV